MTSYIVEGITIDFFGKGLNTLQNEAIRTVVNVVINSDLNFIQ